jgi:N,N'-diacetyllegionaminate synthase
MTKIKIRNKLIGESEPCFLIAEVSQNHDGSLGFAHAFIDAAAEAGADAIKFQTHIAEAESTIDEPFRTNFSYQDQNRYDYWKRMEFSEAQWVGLAEHAKEKNIIFLSSPFSIDAVDLLTKIGMPAWKIGSGELGSRHMIDAIIKNRVPILLSTGMSGWGEIDETVSYLKVKSADFAIFQCTSKYPVSMKEVGLNILGDLKNRYGCPVGLSDHSGVIFPSMAALARGCNLIELHVTFDRRSFGPDVLSSVTFEEFSLIREARDNFFMMDENPVDKEKLSFTFKSMRDLFGKSFALTENSPAGAIITEDKLTLKKPGTGIPAKDIKKILGKKLLNEVPKNRLLKLEDLEK